MNKTLKKLKAALSRGRRPGKDYEDGGEFQDARGADLHLWVLFLFLSIRFQGPHIAFQSTTPISQLDQTGEDVQQGRARTL